MIAFAPLRRFGRGLSWVQLCLHLCAAMALLSACSSSDQRPLVLVSAPLGAYAAQAARVDVTVILDAVPYPQSYAAASYGNGNQGIYLPSGKSGTATVSVMVYDAATCPIAMGSQAGIVVKAGEKTAVVTVTLGPASGSCQASDGGLPAQDDGGAGPGQAGVDGPGPSIDGVPSSSDSGPAVDAGVGPDGASLDGSPAVEDGKDAADAPLGPLLDAGQGADAALEVAGPDVAATFEVAPEVAPDAPSTANVFGHCATYRHIDQSSSIASEVYVTQVLFAPDRKHLISFGADGVARVWDVTSTGLALTGNQLAFSGTSELYGAMSADGKYLAVGDFDGNVEVYDFPASLTAGAAVSVASLSTGLLPRYAYMAKPRAFAADGTHLVVDYRGYYYGEPNQVVVWDVSTQLLARQHDLANDSDYPLAFLAGDFATSMWMASEETVDNSASSGGYDSVITLLNMAPTTMSPIQFTASDMNVYSMAFSPDGSTLALAASGPEVILWDISNKSAMTALGSPLITGSSDWVYAKAVKFSPDGKYLATAITGDSYAVKLSTVQPPRQTLTKTLDYGGLSVAFSSDGLALAVGEDSYGVILYCTP